MQEKLTEDRGRYKIKEVEFNMMKLWNETIEVNHTMSSIVQSSLSEIETQ